jgi:hypothetical protein
MIELFFLRENDSMFDGKINPKINSNEKKTVI